MIRFERKDNDKEWHEFRVGDTHTFHTGSNISTPVIEQRTDWNYNWIISSFDSLSAARNWFLGRSTWVEVVVSAVSSDEQYQLYDGVVLDDGKAKVSNVKHRCHCEWRDVLMYGCRCNGI